MRATRDFAISLGCFALTLLGCSTAQSDLIRICDETGCSMRERAGRSTASLPQEASASRQVEVLYRGEAIPELQKKASGGDPEAAYKLGLVNYYGLAGQRVDHRQAALHFSDGANGGLAASQYRLARLKGKGDGLAQDDAGALRLLHDAATQSYGPAAYELSSWYLGKGSGGPHPTEGFRWCLVAAEFGIAEAQNDIALMYYRGEGTGQDSYQALQWFRKAAGSGSLPAQGALGRIYFEGLDTMGQDLDESERWLRIAAGRGDKEAADLLAAVRQSRIDEENYERYREEWRDRYYLYLSSLRYSYSSWTRVYWTSYSWVPYSSWGYY